MLCFFPGHIGSDATVHYKRASCLVENCGVARKSENVTADAEDLQRFQMPEISGIDSEEACGDLAVIGCSTECVNEAVVSLRHGVVVQIGRHPRLLRFNERPRAIAVAEEPQLIGRVVIAEAAPKHYKAAGNRGRAAIVDWRWIMVLQDITLASKATRENS